MINKRKKIVFLGSKKVGYVCLKSLIDASENLGAEVVGILFNPNGSFKDEFRELGVQYQIPIYESPDDLIGKDKSDLLISVQYHKILKTEHIETAERAVNLHMAPLPEYRGCNQFSFAIIDKSPVFGTTLHKIDEGIDSGEIIAERRFPIPEGCFVQELLDKTVAESISMFDEWLERLVSGEYSAIPQSQFTDRSRSFHKRSDIESVKKIDLSWPQEKIERYIRATLMPGFDGPFFCIGDKEINLGFKAPQL